MGPGPEPTTEVLLERSGTGQEGNFLEKGEEE